MKDRASLYPGRVKLTPVSGQENTYDMVRADEPTQEGDPLSKATFLKDTTASLFGLDLNALPDDVFRVLSMQGWSLLAEYKSAGSFSWTPPDELFEEGETTAIIGVYMVGGGGGGGLGIKQNYNVASGGAAGYGANFIFTVTKGVAISLVVGAGGAGSSNYSQSIRGGNGGSTSFNGKTVSGGTGGGTMGDKSSYGYSISGSDGGQGSDAPDYKERTSKLYAGCASRSTAKTYTFVGGSSQSPRESQNYFDPFMITLCAGGYQSCEGSGTNPTVYTQTILAMPDGTKGGSGSGGNATGNGNGGGGRIASNASFPAGNGSPGMVLIYKRRIPA